MPGIGLEAGEVEEGGVEIKELDGLVANLSFGQAGARDDQGNARAILPNAPLGPAVFFSQVEAMIREENDNGVVLVWAGIEGIQEATHLVVGEADTGEIGLDEGLPLVIFHNPFVGGCDVFQAGEIDGVRREVVEIILAGFGKLKGVERVKIEPFLRGVLWYVRGHESGHEEEGLGALRRKFSGGPIRDFVVGHQFIALGKGSPVPERVSFEGADFFLRNGAEAAEVAGVIGEVGLVFPVVEDLACARDLEAFAFEASREDLGILSGFGRLERWVQKVNAGGFRSDSAEEAGPGGVAHG